MLISTPIAAAFMIHPVPPDDISGSAIPFVGIDAVTTAILIAACNPIIAVIPNATSFPNK